MAVLKIINGKGKYHDPNATKDVINYILNPDKSNHALYGYFQVDPSDPAQSMRDVSISFGKANGIQIRHYVISFASYEISDAITVAQIADCVANYFVSQYQTVYAVHEDGRCLHVHIVCNAVNYNTGERYHGSKKEYYDFTVYLKRLLRKFGVNRLIIEHI